MIESLSSDLVAVRFGRWLRSARRARHWSQEQLADRVASLSLHSIKSYEQGIRCPTLWAVVHLREALGLPYEELFASPVQSEPHYIAPARQGEPFPFVLDGPRDARRPR
jgi:transcriptional regulator with XRE-family HTH domain